MSSRSSGPVNRPATIALWLMVLAVGVGCVAAASADAAQYKAVFCGANNGSGNPTLGANPGFFNFVDHCGTAYSDPAGDGGFLRLEENTGGTAGLYDSASMSWYAPAGTSILMGTGYTRQPNEFNDGWRGRFWAEDWGGGTNNILMQGNNTPNDGIYATATSFFAHHPWPFGGAFGNYKRFVFELTCFRPGGCSRSGLNAVDANTIVILLDDQQGAKVSFDDGPVVRGDWVRGYHAVAWYESDQGSGLRFSRLGADGAVFGNGTIDYQANGGCHTGYSNPNQEFGRRLQPCGSGPYLRYYGLDTKTLSDGEHELSICIQDYAQHLGLNGTGGQSCERRTIRTDNSVPGKPAGLRVTSANPERYLDRFSAEFSLPPNVGSPIVKVHYDVIDDAGKVVVPEKVLSGSNPTALSNVEGPAKPGAYNLRVWLEDQVGYIGQAASAPIPHDRTPPAAPQDLSVTAPATARSTQGFDVRWRNLVDAGSRIDAAHYRIVDGRGEVVVPATTVPADNPQSIQNLDTPRERGSYILELWLSDAEQNAGAPVKAPLAYDCGRSEASGGSNLTAGLGQRGDAALLVRQGEGSTLRGTLQGLAHSGSAPVCVFSRVVTDSERQFLGVAMTDPDGSYQFAIGAGPSRDVTAVYRRDQRELSARAALRTRVHPTFQLHRKVVRNKRFAIFKGEIPGPRNNEVIVVLQVKSGKAWRVFRRYRTRPNGRFVMRYRFTQTQTPTVYIMRAQVRAQSGYPYEEGNSQARRLRVVPFRSRARRAHSARADSQTRPARP